MLLSQANWNNDGLNQEIERQQEETKIPGFADHVANMNKTNMNFGAKANLDENEFTTEDEPDGSGTTANSRKKKHKVKRFESSKFTTSDMFDPDHGPSEISERIEEDTSVI